MTCAIAHKEDDSIVIDALHEIRAPFNPEDAVSEFTRLFHMYGCSQTHGDRYAASWVTTAFERQGIEYRHTPMRKSDLYRNLLPHLNSRTIRLLDNPRSINQLANLERRTVRGGGDTIDHPQNGQDDLCNAIAGAAYHTIDRAQTPEAVFGFTYNFQR